MRILVTPGNQASGSFLLNLLPTGCDTMVGPADAFYLKAMEGAHFECLGALLTLCQMKPMTIDGGKSHAFMGASSRTQAQCHLPTCIFRSAS